MKSININNTANVSEKYGNDEMKNPKSAQLKRRAGEKEKIYVTSFTKRGNDIVAKSLRMEGYTEIGRPNGFDFISGEAQRKMELLGGYDVPCFFNHCPTNDGIYAVTIVYQGTTSKGTYFLWTDKNNDKRGLIIEDGDVEGYDSANASFKNKHVII